MSTLTDAEREILAIERKWWAFSGAKEQAIRDRLDLSATQFYMQLSRLLDTERALAADPVTVNRLRRLRDGRKHGRITAAEHPQHAPKRTAH